MNFFDPFLGFAVLTGPLWLILILLPVCIWLAIKIAKRFKPGIARVAGGIGIFLLFFALPFGDEIAGRIYFNYLCETESGGQTFKVIELGNEFFLKPGEIDMNTAGHLPAKGGELNIKKIEEYFSVVRKSIEISRIFKINKYEVSITEKPTGNAIARHTNFSYFGGWLARHSTPHVTGIRCPLPDDSYRQFYSATFKPTKSED